MTGQENMAELGEELCIENRSADEQAQGCTDGSEARAGRSAAEHCMLPPTQHDNNTNRHMRALNRAFEKAFEHSGSENNIAELLTCMGEEMHCKRISIFEENEEGTCDNTYEWCRPGVVHEQILLQHIEIEKFDSWHDRLIGREIIVILDPEEVREHDPDIYRMFTEQGIHSAIVTLLAFHGKNFGFCILEDPDDDVMEDAMLIIPGIRYILSSMIYSRNLVSRLRRVGYTDALTGAGNMVSLQEHLRAIDPSRPTGIATVEVIGWDDPEGKILHLEKEQTLLRAGDILTELFDEEHVFRLAGGEFVIVENGEDEASFENDLRTLRGLLREHNILAAATGEWSEVVTENTESIIHRVHQSTEAEKKTILSHRDSSRRHRTAVEDEGENANISLPKGDEFFRIADRYLTDLYSEAVTTIVTDINYFKMYNDIFGRRAGNIYLENMASAVTSFAEARGGISGYIGGDNFCIIVPAEMTDIAGIRPEIEEMYSSIKFPDGFSPAMGVYYSDDRRETMITLYDRAMSALADIKGDYMNHIHFYSAEMHHHQKEDKLLLMNVKEGLANGEFVFYVQPQVHERSGKIIGGEALCRWIHEGKMISPGRFIPMLEKTGYVYAVDSYLWDAVARWQRSLIDRGIKPVSISVNVSRVDFYFDDIADHFIKLVQKYDIDPELLGIEITESAFTDNIDTILDAIRRLHEAGFHILMDDFGSGSSSLSMLHTMNLDVLKTDVQFMSRDKQDNKAISIVESIISMAHMIGMSVVTEGVETEEQKESLIALGDNFAQGYYFYRPMPKENFEALISDRSNVAEGYKKTDVVTAGSLSFKDMIREGLVSETLLDTIIRAAAVLREENGRVSVVQINDLYTAVTGISLRESGTFDLSAKLNEEQAADLKRMLEEAGSRPLGGSEGVLTMPRPDGELVTVNLRIFQLYSLDNHSLYLSTMA